MKLHDFDPPKHFKLVDDFVDKLIILTHSATDDIQDGCGLYMNGDTFEELSREMKKLYPMKELSAEEKILKKLDEIIEWLKCIRHKDSDPVKDTTTYFLGFPLINMRYNIGKETLPDGDVHLGYRKDDIGKVLDKINIKDKP